MKRAAEERPGAMIAIVDLNQAQIEEILAEAGKSGKLYLANRNASVQFVLSGEIPAVQEAERLALAAGARRALILTIPLAAHSPLMAKAGAEFKQVFDGLEKSKPALQILANAAGNPHRPAGASRDQPANTRRRPRQAGRARGPLHAGRGGRLKDRFMRRVTFMRAKNPISGTNWEGTGVAPDIEVSAEKALERAVGEARKGKK